MPFCRKCGVEISDNQFKNSNRTCSKCLVLKMEPQTPQTQKKKTRRAKIKDNQFLIIIVLVFLGITALGTSIVIPVHYWILTSFSDPDLEFGEFFIEYFLPDVIIGFFVGVITIIIIVVIYSMND